MIGVKQYFTIIAISIPLALAVFLEYKIFMIWPQITYLWQGNINPFLEFSDIGPHALRYTVIYPVLLLSEIMNVHYDLVFSYFVIIIYFFTCIFVSKSIGLYGVTRRDVNYSVVFVACTLEMLMFLMNGRMTVSLLGYSIVIFYILKMHTHSQVNIQSLVALILGFTLCGVSSGAIISALSIYLFYMITLTYKLFNNGEFRSYFKNILIISVTFYIFIDILISMITKNLNFYGGGLGGFLEMLNHGYGVILYKLNGLQIFLMAVSILVFGLVYVFYYHTSRLSLLASMLIISVCCGAFGYSTLAMAAIPTMLLVILTLNDLALTNRRKPLDYRDVGNYPALREAK